MFELVLFILYLIAAIVFWTKFNSMHEHLKFQSKEMRRQTRLLEDILGPRQDRESANAGKSQPEKDAEKSADQEMIRPKN